MNFFCRRSQSCWRRSVYTGQVCFASVICCRWRIFRSSIMPYARRFLISRAKRCQVQFRWCVHVSHYSDEATPLCVQQVCVYIMSFPTFQFSWYSSNSTYSICCGFVVDKSKASSKSTTNRIGGVWAYRRRLFIFFSGCKYFLSLCLHDN